MLRYKTVGMKFFVCFVFFTLVRNVRQAETFYELTVASDECETHCIGVFIVTRVFFLLLLNELLGRFQSCN